MFRIVLILSIIAPICNLCRLGATLGPIRERTTGLLRATHGNIGLFEGRNGTGWAMQTFARSERERRPTDCRYSIPALWLDCRDPVSVSYHSEEEASCARRAPFRHRATHPRNGSFEPTDVSDSDPNPPIPSCALPLHAGEWRSLCALDPYFIPSEVRDRPGPARI